MAISFPAAQAGAVAYAGGSSSSITSFGAGFPADTGSMRAALTALENKNGSEALRLIAGINNPVLIDVVTGLAMGQDDSPYDFLTAQQFLASHSFWPESDRNAIARQAEKKIGDNVSPQELLAFFSAYPPQTGDGFVKYIDTLNAMRQPQKIALAIRTRWRETNMGDDEQGIFLNRFNAYITSADTAYRLDRTLWDKQFDQAKRLFPLVSTGMRKLAEARIALSRGDKNAPTLVNSVPSNLQSDAGLMYERTKWRRKQNDSEGAYALIRAAGNNLGKPDKWWDERNTIARDLLEQNNYNAAYAVAAQHGIARGQEFSDAEFMAGWIALRFLNNPSVALAHFQRLNANATAPITFARGAYWIGRASEALGDTANAQSWLTRAASFGTTYYGQLAAAHLYPASQISASAPPISPDAVANFQNLMITQIVSECAQAGAKKIAERFALAYAANATQETDFRLMAGYMLQLNLPDVAVKVAKAAAKKQIVLPVEGYPVLNIVARENAALAHAIIRQESQFDAGIASSSNAQGLMQLLPSTARHVAKKSGLSVDPDDLYDPQTNVILGTAYIDELLGNFNGALPLTIGAYNAGPGRMRQWLNSSMGDPRGRTLDDVIDWVERIPYSETRNYVQRVMEALQLYRAKLSGGAALLGISKDMTN